MRLVVFDEYRIGVLGGDEVREISEVVPGWRPNDRHAMNRLIASWDELLPAIDRMVSQASPRPIDAVTLRPPVPLPTHLFAAPINYAEHAGELRRQGYPGTSETPRSEATAETLGFFLKAPGSISGASEPIGLPIRDLPGRRFDHEGELAFVVGRDCKAVEPDDALSCVFGYTMLVDVRLRGSKERHEERVQRKSFASFSPMGPCLVTADEAGPWEELGVRVTVNGEQRQDARAGDMIVKVPDLLSRASHVVPLSAGDVYTTGSPPGVGAILPGDEVVVESSMLGKMVLHVVERSW